MLWVFDQNLSLIYSKFKNRVKTIIRIIWPKIFHKILTPNLLDFSFSKHIQKKQNKISGGIFFHRLGKYVKASPWELKKWPDRHARRPARLRVKTWPSGATPLSTSATHFFVVERWRSCDKSKLKLDQKFLSKLFTFEQKILQDNFLTVPCILKHDHWAGKQSPPKIKQNLNRSQSVVILHAWVVFCRRIFYQK